MSNTTSEQLVIPSSKLSRGERILRGLWRLRVGMLGFLLVFTLIFSAIFAPWIAPHDPYEQNITNRNTGPAICSRHLGPMLPCSKKASWDHPLGTDQLGRDMLSRIIYGARISLRIGVLAVVIAFCIGVLLGLFSGYFSGHIDTVVNLAVNVWMGFPFILLAMVLVSVLGQSETNIIIALGVTSWPVFCRVVRVEVMNLKEREFAVAAQGLGNTALRIIFRHILPNVMPSIIVIATVEVARAIIREALISFLGLGITPPTPSWGVMLAEGRNYMVFAGHLALFPGLAIFMGALGINLMGDALRDLIDPHTDV